MKQVLLISISLIIILSLSFRNSHKDKKSIVNGIQTVYAYQNESIGFSDIKKLYTPDTSQVKRSFFKGNSLRNIKAGINCTITKTAMQKNKDSSVMVFRVTDPVITIENDHTKMNTDDVKKEITSPVFAVFSSNGKIKAIRTDAAISNFSASILKEIVSRFQFVCPVLKTKDWQIKEANSTGNFTAGYHFIKEGNGVYEYEKTNNGYTDKELLQRNQQFNPEGRSIIQTDSLNNIRNEDISETLTTLFGKDTVSVSGSKTRIQLISATSIPADSLLQFNQLMASANYQRSFVLGTILTDDEIQQLAYSNTLGRDNWESLIQALHKLVNPDNATKESLILKFRALAVLSSQDCKNIGAVLEQEPFGTVVFEILSHALFRTKTIAATDVIAKLIDSRKQDEDVVTALLTALATTTAPTDQAVNIARQLGFESNANADITTTAQLALGGMAYHLKQANEQKATMLTHYLVEKLKNEQDTLKEILVLGNTGSRLILPVLKSFITNLKVSTAVRTYAVSSLRLVQSSEVTPFIKKIRYGNDSTLLKTVNETLAFREMNGVN